MEKMAGGEDYIADSEVIYGAILGAEKMAVAGMWFKIFWHWLPPLIFGVEGCENDFADTEVQYLLHDFRHEKTCHGLFWS